jgi:hypothetical protein
MLCPICFGRRLFYLNGQLLPCPECEGHGEVHCCDGLQAQPEEQAPQQANDHAVRNEPRTRLPRHDH